MDQQPVPPNPSAPAAAPDAHYQMPNTNPGQTTGIIGLILPFVALSPVGLVLSIISTVQSSKANAPKTIGIIGIVVNAIGILVTAFLLLVIITLSSYSNIQERAVDSTTRSSATLVRQQAEAFYASEGYYPASMRDIVMTIETSLPDTRLIEGTPKNAGEVGYKQCGETGASIEYILSPSTVPATLYLGSGSAETC